MRSRLREVRDVCPAEKFALSRSTSVVASVISESSPPMTPASATGVWPSSVMTGHVRGERALLAVQRDELLAVARGAHHDVAAAVALGELAQVKGVERLTGEVHNVVGHVHDVVDRAPARGRHAPGQPLRRRADLDVADPRARCSAGRARVGDRHVHEVGGVRTGLGGHMRQLDVGVLVKNRRDLGGKAGHGEAVGAVGVISQSITVSELPR